MLFKHILVAYDGSNHSKKALDKAIAFAESNMAEKLSVVHVFNLQTFVIGEAVMTTPVSADVKWFEYAEEVVAEAKEKVKHLNAEVTMLQGYPSKQILDYANSNGCDLLIMGSRGLGPIREIFLGSVSHNIVQQADIPVLIVR